MANTTDAELTACERTDHILDVVLGQTLEQAVVRLGIFGGVIGAVIATLATLL